MDGHPVRSIREDHRIRAAVRALRRVGVQATADTAPLETLRLNEGPPRLEASAPIEGAQLSARRVPGAPVVGFAAFLDGIQRTRVVAYVGRTGVPIIHGAMAVAVRQRVGRRLRTWGIPRVGHDLYAPLSVLRPVLSLDEFFWPVICTDIQSDAHPREYTARAVAAVQRRRERNEVDLAEEWVGRERTPLLVDGGISGAGTAARHPLAVGVVKSHRTLYATGDSVATVLGLREGERTTAVELSSPKRVPVASWYLRLRGHGERSPFFGLVRVEVAREGEITERADLVSRWLLAERIPVSLPDPRWDVMLYGIRDCEQYLSAIIA